MTDAMKTKAQLIAELKDLRRRISELKASEKQRELKTSRRVTSKSPGETSSSAFGKFGRKRQSAGRRELTAQHLSTLIAHMPGGLIIETQGREVLQVNKKFCEMFAIDAPPEALKGADCRQATRQVKHLFVNSEAFVTRIDEILAAKQSVLNEELALGDGRVFERDYMPAEFGNGQMEHLWYYRDITEQKKSEEKYRKIFENVRDVFYQTGYDGMITEISPSIERHSGYTREALIGKPIADFYFYPKDYLELCQKLEDIGEVNDFEVRLKDQESRLIYVSVNARIVFDNDGKPVATEGTLRDVTERKLAEKGLRESERKYKNLFRLFRAISDNMTDMLWAKDMNTKYIFANKAICKNLLSAKNTDEPMGKTDMFFAERERRRHPENPQWHTFGEICRDSDKAIVDTQRPGRFDEFGNVKGQFLYLDVYKSPLLDEQGKMVGVVGSGRDVTKEKAILKQLEESEAKNRLLAALVEQASEAIAITDLEGRLEYVNPAFEKLTGYSAAEALGRNPRILKSGKHDNTFYENIWDTLLHGDTWSGRFVNKRKDDSRYYEETVVFPIKNTAGQIVNFCQIGRDVSREQELERQLRQAQKLETIGTLAGGIAHDFNNILTPILCYTDMALNSLAATDPLRDDLRQVLKGAHRAKDLVNQILTFSRLQEHERQPLQLHLLIKEALQFMRPSIPTTIEIQERIDPSCEKVSADPTRIHQVIVNLCTNAFHAMEENGGVLTIELRQVEVDAITARLYPNLERKEYARLTVSDTGTGMNDTARERIFEPFFTTKAVDKGTGLGLSVVHGIARSHEGEIIVKSEPGKGSAFQLYLPILTGGLETGEKNMESIPGGRESILVVDDEKTVIEVMRKMLRRLGYRVVAKSSSLEGLKAFRERPGEFDLVITDLTMPHMTGLELAKEIARLRSEIPVILMTGYGEGLEGDVQKHYGVQAIVGKPIVLRELALVIRKIIDKPSVASRLMGSIR